MLKNPDAAEAHVNPYLHYLDHGIGEDRRARLLFDPKF